MSSKIERTEECAGFFKKTWEQFVDATLGDKLFTVAVLFFVAITSLVVILGFYLELMKNC